MLSIECRHWCLLFAALVALCLTPAAQARHHHHHRHGWSDDYEDRASDDARESRSEPARGTQPRADGFLGAATARMISACDGQGAELQKMPVDAVVRTVQPNDDQRAALDRIRAAATDAANKLAASCPKNVPARPSDRLDTMRASLETIKAALLPLRPAFVSAYATFDDEQKARLVAAAISQQTAPQPDTGARHARLAARDQAPLGSLGCQQWPALLKTWPLNRIESGLSLSDGQRAALYVLTAAIYRSAADLDASCHDENALTPVSRLDAELKRVEAMRQCIDAIAPALAGFVNGLNGEQKAQLNAMLGVAPQPETTAR